MMRLIFAFVFMVLIIPLDSATVHETESDRTLEDQERVLSQAYVQIPDFQVIKQSDERIFTVIKHANAPESFEGSLLRLTGDGIEDLTMAADNLGIEKLVLFEQDSELATELSERGYQVTMI